MVDVDINASYKCWDQQSCNSNDNDKQSLHTQQSKNFYIRLL